MAVTQCSLVGLAAQFKWDREASGEYIVGKPHSSRKPARPPYGNSPDDIFMSLPGLPERRGTI
uniref:Uncharacterized protein n=1 Tax=Anguilla anguilla TaxID=7936 RepID=A0A0E9TTP4_ANGAN